MNRLKTIIIVTITSALAICSAPFVSYMMTDDITIYTADTYSGTVFSDGIYYYLDADKGVYMCGIPDKLLIEGKFKSFCIDGKKLYCYEKASGKRSSRTVLHAFDKNTGTPLGEFEVPDNIHGDIKDGIVYARYTQKVTNKPFFRFYDINNDFKEVYIENERHDINGAAVFDFADGTQKIISGENKVIDNSKSHMIILSEKDNKNCELYFDYFENRAPSFSEIPNVQTYCVSGDKLFTAYTVTRFFTGNKQERNEIRHNKYDAVRVYDTETGNIINEKQFRRTERVLSVSENTIITYFNNNYIWYDSSNFNEIKKQPADKIKDGKEYTVTTVEGIVFVFCNEKMIDRIAH